MANHNRIILRINTCINPAFVQLEGKINDKIAWDQKAHRAEYLVNAIDQILTRHKLKLSEVELKINNFCRKGSYTGHRIGIAVVNALNFSCGKNKIIKPRYGQAAKITLPKK